MNRLLAILLGLLLAAAQTVVAAAAPACPPGGNAARCDNAACRASTCADCGCRVGESSNDTAPAREAGTSARSREPLPGVPTAAPPSHYLPDPPELFSSAPKLSPAAPALPLFLRNCLLLL